MTSVWGRPGLRGGAVLGAVTACGLLLFLWPFAGADAPPAAAPLAIMLGGIAVLVFIELSTRKLDARRFALLGAVAAIDAALRLVLVTGIGGFSPVFFLILVTGYVYGPSFGFLCGATSLLASSIATGGIGPWLPYETFACGWMGAAAGLAGLHRGDAQPSWRDIAVLAAVAVFSGYAYGALLDIWDWTVFYRGTPSFGFITQADVATQLQRFTRFYLTTSAAWDSFRAAGDALAVIVLGAPVMAALARIRSRMSFTVASAGASQPMSPPA